MTTRSSANVVRDGFLSSLALIQQIHSPSVIPERQRHRYSIENVHTGGVILFGGTLYVVEEISVYAELAEGFGRATGYKWYELKLVNPLNGDALWLEWEKDDTLVISRTLDTLGFNDLADEDDEGIDEEDLEQIANDEDSVYYDGTEYEYDDDYPALYHRGTTNVDGDGADMVMFYDFVNGSETITIEEWIDNAGEADYQIYLSEAIPSAAITIVALGKESD